MMKLKNKTTRILLLIAIGLIVVPIQSTLAQINKEPDELEGVEITEHLKAQVPLDATFTDSEGKEVQLKQYFDGKRPVLLTLVYYRCPMLCGILLDGLMDGITNVPLDIGKDYRIVTLSFDPLETPDLAKVNKQRRLKEYGRKGAGEGWHFLTGQQDNITKVADTVGFGYTWNEKRKEYAHVAAVMVLTPGGVLSRYLYGIEFDPQTLRLSLVEASEGKIGTTLDKLILTCFQYDPADSQYGPAAMKIMRLGGIVTILIVGAFLGFFWLRESRKQQRTGTEATGEVRP